MKLKKGDIVYLDKIQCGNLNWYHPHKMRIVSVRDGNVYNVYILITKKYNFYHSTYLVMDKAATRSYKISLIE